MPLRGLNSYTDLLIKMSPQLKGVCVPYSYELICKDGTQILKISRHLRDKGTFCRTRGHFLSDKGTFLSDKGTFVGQGDIFVGQGNIIVKIT